jgi:transcription antitermination factor NusG
MSDEDLDSLLEDLFHLNIRTIQTLDSIASIRAQQRGRILEALQQAQHTQQYNHPSSEVIPVEGSSEAEVTHTEGSSSEVENKQSFRPGDRVIITNGFLRGTHNKEAIVTKIKGDRIHLKTSDGFYTWRIAKNIRFA